MERGDSQILFSGNVAVIVWIDEKPIYFATSSHVTSPAESVLRYNSNEHKRTAISCPKPVKSYNTFMGGTDKNDQMTRLQKM